MTKNPKTVMKQAAALKADLQRELAQTKAERDWLEKAFRRQELEADRFARRVVELNREAGR